MEWKCCFKNESLRQPLEDILPKTFQYKVTAFDPIPSAKVSNESQFTATISVNICTKEALLEFIEAFENITNTNYNIGTKTDNTKSKSLLISGSRKCIHNLQKRNKHTKDASEGKNTECPSKFTFRISNKEHNHEEECQSFMTEIDIVYKHNHSINSASAVKYHNVTEETKQKLLDLFKAGYSASRAYDKYKTMLEDQHKGNFVKISADRGVMPDKKYFFNLHEKYVKEHYGKLNSIESFKIAQQRVQQYNEENGDSLAKIEQLDNGQWYVTVCDTFTRRVHEVLPQSGNICFVDSTSSLDRGDARFFRFLTCSPAGEIYIFIILSL